MSIFSGTIKSRVMKQINEKIEKAEQDYIADCKEIDEKAEIEKGRVADEHVAKILGKIM